MKKWRGVKCCIEAEHNGNAVFLTSVNMSLTGNENTYYALANGNVVPLSEITIYGHHLSYIRMEDWFRAMMYLEETGEKEILIDNMGCAYHFESTDFEKHYG